MKERNANKKIKKKSPLRFFKPALLLISGILAIIIIRDRFFPQKTVAIVHNNQNTTNIEYALTDKKVGIYNVDTSQFRLEDVERMIDEADGVIFAGGNDFDPSLYGGNQDLVEDYSREDDEKSIGIFTYAIEKNKPILGICRGMQLMNIYYGGSLYDDIKTQYSTEIIHRGEDKTFAYHSVNIRDDSYLKEIIGENQIEVNSFHHEGIRKLADGLDVSAESPDGLIEAIENPYYPYMIGVQWHPEASYIDDEYSKRIFDDFTRKLK